MIDRVKAFREPATIVAIVVVLVGIAVTSGRIATDLHTYPLAHVLRGVSGLYGLVDALVLTVLALSCVLIGPQTRHAPLLTRAASLLLWLGAVVGLVFLVVLLLAAGQGSWSRLLESVGGLTDIALRGLMGYVLILGGRVATMPVPTSVPTPAVLPSGTAALEPREDSLEPREDSLEPREDPSRRPVWQPDEATGVVWRSAADAASGVAAGTYQSAGGTWAVPATDPPPVRPPSVDQPSGPRIVGPEVEALAPRSGPPVWDPAADVTRRDREPETGREDPYS